MNTPANGPISEYGRYSTAKAAAPEAGFGKFVELKKTKPPRTAVNRPSPVCEISRVENSFRKSCSAHTTRRSPRNERRRGGPAGPAAGGCPDEPAFGGAGGKGSCLVTPISLGMPERP